MAITGVDALKANVVLLGLELLDSEAGFEAFKTESETEVIAEMSLAGVFGGLPETGRRINLPKDRITLIATSGRSVIEREYPSYGDLDRLADVVSHAISYTKVESSQVQALGYNVDITYNQDSGLRAMEYLAQRLYSQSFLSRENRRILGGSGKLSFVGEGRTWNFSIEPRLNDNKTTKVFLGLNMHIDSTSVPEKDAVAACLRESWNSAHDFAVELDEVVR